MTKPKKSDLIKAQNFAKVNSSKMDFLTVKAKEAFIHLSKAFSKAPILRHFDMESYIWIETDVLEYVIGRVLNQITSDYSDKIFSNHITYKNLNTISFRSEISR